MIREFAFMSLAVGLMGCSPAEETQATPSSEQTERKAASASENPYAPQPYVKLLHPEWSRDAVLYQINTRQFTEEGTFKAAQAHLPRLADMGVDILWLMPIHPIGEVNRKGSLGSPYSVKDYLGVNPEFGTVEDLRAFVDEAHSLGMHVILDWVANHTAWDNPLAEEHPEWFLRTADGQFQPPMGTDWSDVIQLDFTSPELRRYMTKALRYWVEDVGVDGFRADVAGFVPLDFWETARAELDSVKPVFMLAEWEERDLHARAFDATYGWSFKDVLHDVAAGNADAGALRGWFISHQMTWPTDGYRMLYTANHDQNSWDGYAREIYGPWLEAAIVLTFTGEGIPLIYNGQEAGLDHRLDFFEKDQIIWREDPLDDLFRTLTSLKENISALDSGGAGARMVPLSTDHGADVFAFTRLKDGDGVLVAVSTSDAAINLAFDEDVLDNQWIDIFSGEAINIEDGLSIDPYGYRVLRRGEKRPL